MQSCIDRSQLDMACVEIYKNLYRLYKLPYDTRVFEGQLDREFASPASSKYYFLTKNPLWKRVGDVRDTATMEGSQGSTKSMLSYFQYGDNTGDVYNAYQQHAAGNGMAPNTGTDWRNQFPDPRSDRSLACVKTFFSNAGGVAHWHYVCFGLSNLYSFQSGEVSGAGFELTMRAAATSKDGPLDYPVVLLEQIYNYVSTTGATFEHGQSIIGQQSVFPDVPSLLYGWGICTDPELGVIETRSGKIAMLQLVGLSQRELEDAQVHKSCLPVIQRMQFNNRFLVTDYTRKQEYLAS